MHHSIHTDKMHDRRATQQTPSPQYSYDNNFDVTHFTMLVSQALADTLHVGFFVVVCSCAWWFVGNVIYTIRGRFAYVLQFMRDDGTTTSLSFSLTV